MSGDKRITRQQAAKDPESKKELEAFYTEPFTSTPFPGSKPNESATFSVGEPKTLFLEETPTDLPSVSSAFDASGSQTIKLDETLKFQDYSEPQSSAENSDEENKEVTPIKSPADISALFKKNSQSEDSSVSSHSSIIEDKMTGQTISLKDALRVVPEFSGSNIPLGQFLEGCDVAKAMIDTIDEKTFTKLLRSKVSGEARQTIVNQTFDTIDSLKDYLKNIYSPAKSVHQLMGELGNEFQKDEDSVVAYANRMRDLGNRILEAERIRSGPVQPAFKVNTETSVIECFKRGLRPEIEQRIRAEDTIDNIMKDAIRIERLLDAQRDLRKSVPTRDPRPVIKKHVHYCAVCQVAGHESNNCPRSRFCEYCKRTNHSTEQCFRKLPDQANSIKCQFCGKFGHSAKICQLSPQSNQTIICQYCKKQGHLANNCFQISNASSQLQNDRLTCQYCGKTGHAADKCFLLPERTSENVNNSAETRPPLTCQICKKTGHTAATCYSSPSNQNTQSGLNPIICNYCKNPGHNIKECRKREYNNARRAGNEMGLLQSSVEKETLPMKTRSMNATQIDDLLEELIPLD